MSCLSSLYSADTSEDTLPWPLIINQGDTWNVTIIWTDSEDEPVDLSGVTGAMQLRRFFGYPVLLDITTENGRMEIVGPEGRIEISVDNDTMSAIKISAGVFDLKLTYPDGVRSTLMRGEWQLKYEVTHGS